MASNRSSNERANTSWRNPTPISRRLRDNAAEHLVLCQTLPHNDDYLEFLVTRVWMLNRACRLAEFGCGSGVMGLRLYLGYSNLCELVE